MTLVVTASENAVFLNFSIVVFKLCFLDGVWRTVAHLELSCGGKDEKEDQEMRQKSGS
jgi:hypothetical protein